MIALDWLYLCGRWDPADPLRLTPYFRAFWIMRMGAVTLN